MAEKLKDFDFNKGLGPKRKLYPIELFDGEIWRLTRGRDFDEKLKTQTVITSLRKQAKEMGKFVRTKSESEDTIVIRVETRGRNNGR